VKKSTEIHLKNSRKRSDKIIEDGYLISFYFVLFYFIFRSFQMLRDKTIVIPNLKDATTAKLKANFELYGVNTILLEHEAQLDYFKRNSSPDLIISEVGTQSINVDFLQKVIKTCNNLKAVPFIMIAATRQQAGLQQMIDLLHPDMVYYKPFSFKDLLRKIKALMNGEVALRGSGDGGDEQPTQEGNQQELQDIPSEGDCSKVSIVNVFKHIICTKQTCELQLSRLNSSRKIFFSNGQMSFLTFSFSPKSNIGSSLVDRRIISPEDYETAFSQLFFLHRNLVHETCSYDNHMLNEKLGELLVAIQAIAPHQFYDLYQEEIHEKFIASFDWKSGNYKIWPVQRLPNRRHLEIQQPVAQVYKAVKRYLRLVDQRKFFSRLEDCLYLQNPDWLEATGEIPLMKADRQFMLLLHRRTHLRDAMKESGMNSSRAYILLILLDIFGQLTYSLRNGIVIKSDRIDLEPGVAPFISENVPSAPSSIRHERPVGSAQPNPDAVRLAAAKQAPQPQTAKPYANSTRPEGIKREITPQAISPKNAERLPPAPSAANMSKPLAENRPPRPPMSHVQGSPSPVSPVSAGPVVPPKVLDPIMVPNIPNPPPLDRRPELARMAQASPPVLAAEPVKPADQPMDTTSASHKLNRYSPTQQIASSLSGGKQIDGEVTHLAHFRVVEKIGEGGMGKIYKGYDESLDRIVALKVISKDVIKDEYFFKNFINEAKVLAKLNCPQITQIYYIDNRKPYPFYAMEFIDGTTLEVVVKRHRIIPLKTALHIALEVCKGLDFAYAHKIIHRDISPANVMVTYQGEVKITDFGLAKQINIEEREEQVFGTPLYIAPERIVGQPADFRADIYSLGVTLYQLITGALPFWSENTCELLKMHLRNPFPDIRKLDQNIPRQVSAILQRATEKVPSKRYPDYQAMIADLQNTIQSLDQKKTPLGPKENGDNTEIEVSMDAALAQLVLANRTGNGTAAASPSHRG
jgi:serine/threonine-protein kinase